MDGAASAMRCSTASRVSSSPAKRWKRASADSSTLTSKPRFVSRLTARRSGVALATTPEGENRVRSLIEGDRSRAARPPRPNQPPPRPAGGPQPLQQLFQKLRLRIPGNSLETPVSQLLEHF